MFPSISRPRAVTPPPPMSEVLSQSLFLLQQLLPMMQMLGIPSEISEPHLCAAWARKPPYPSLLRHTAGLRCGSIRYSRSLPGQPCFGPSSRSQRHKSTWFCPWVLQPFSSFDSLPLGPRLGRTSSSQCRCVSCAFQWRSWRYLAPSSGSRLPSQQTWRGSLALWVPWS